MSLSETREDEVGVGLFIRQNIFLLLQGEADFIEAVQEAMTAKPVDFQVECQPVIGGDLLFFQVHLQSITRKAADMLEKQFDLRLAEMNREEPVLKAITVKDIGEGGRDDAAEAEIQKRPGRVLPRGAAAEIGPGHQDARPAVAFGIHFKLRVREAAVNQAPIIKKISPEAASL